MTIIEKRVYQARSLPKAPERATRAEAEADEARGVEVRAYLALLPTLTAEQWDAARDAAWDAARDAAWGAAWGAAAKAALGAASKAASKAALKAASKAAWGAVAIVVRDLITVEQFEILTAPMRAAGIDFDALVPKSHDSETGEQ